MPNSPQIIYQIPPFSELPKEALDTLVTTATLRHMEKGAVLFLQGDEAKTLYVVASGWVKLFRETLDGQENVVALCSAGEVFGEAALAEPRTYPFSAQTTEKTTLVTLPLSNIQALLATYPEFSLRVLNRAMQQMRQLELKIEHITSMNAPQRISCYLLSLCPADSHGEQQLTLPVDKSLIAAELGMKPETFSRALQQLKGWGVAVDGEHITIRDMRHLQHQACSSCSNTAQCLGEGTL